jgi:hypothetical protein
VWYVSVRHGIHVLLPEAPEARENVPNLHSTQSVSILLEKKPDFSPNLNPNQNPKPETRKKVPQFFMLD